MTHAKSPVLDCAHVAPPSGAARRRVGRRCSSCCATAGRGRGPSSSRPPAWPARRSGCAWTRCSSSGSSCPSPSRSSTGGRPPDAVRVQPRARVVALGADVGATHARLAVTDLDGDGPRRAPRGRSTSPTARSRCCAGWCAAARRCCARPAAARTSCSGSASGCPGPVEHSTGRPDQPADHARLGRLRRARHRGHRPRLPRAGRQRRQRDGARRAGARRALGTATRLDDMLFVKVATGIGAGIISGGRLHRGAQGAAGDLGHVQAPPAATPCAAAATPAASRRSQSAPRSPPS